MSFSKKIDTSNVELPFNLNKAFNSKKDSKNGLTSFLTSIGAIVNIIWFLSIFLNPPVKPELFVEIGIISLILTVIIRLYSRLTITSNTAELKVGGSIVGFVFTWILVQFYSQKSMVVTFYGYSDTVNQYLSYLLIGVFIIWFFIPSKSLASQELIFNFPPILSYFILNLWKLIIIMKFLVLSWRLNQYDGFINGLLLLICVLEILGMYQRIFKLEITDIILDLFQIVTEIIRGPLISMRWSLLILALILLNDLHSDPIVLLVLGFSIFMSIISFMTFISKLTLDSGLIQRKADQTKVIVPQIFNEIKELKTEDFHENYYQVLENFQLRSKTKVKSYYQGQILFRIPLQNTVESLSGVYIANLSFDKNKHSKRRDKRRKSISQEIRESIKEDIKEDIEKDTKKEIKKYSKQWNFNLQIKSVGKFTIQEWENIIKTKKVQQIDSEGVLTQIGFSDKEQFDNMVDQNLKNFAKIQDNVRDRIRGVPALWNPGEKYVIDSFEQGLKLPDEILDELKKENITKLEIIPGKDEFLFYVKKKK